MAADGASGMAVGFGLKSGAIAALGAAVVSLLAILVGFTVIPLTPGKEMLDAARRLGAGLLCSFTLGPFMAAEVLTHWPEYPQALQRMLKTSPDDFATNFVAATPFIALTGIVGFWLVAAVMRFFANREGEDALQILKDVRDTVQGRDSTQESEDAPRR